LLGSIGPPWLSCIGNQTCRAYIYFSHPPGQGHQFFLSECLLVYCLFLHWRSPPLFRRDGLPSATGRLNVLLHSWDHRMKPPGFRPFDCPLFAKFWTFFFGIWGAQSAPLSPSVFPPELLSNSSRLLFPYFFVPFYTPFFNPFPFDRFALVARIRSVPLSSPLEAIFVK